MLTIASSPEGIIDGDFYDAVNAVFAGEVENFERCIYRILEHVDTPAVSFRYSDLAGPVVGVERNHGAEGGRRPKGVIRAILVSKEEPLAAGPHCIDCFDTEHSNDAVRRLERHHDHYGVFVGRITYDNVGVVVFRCRRLRTARIEDEEEGD